MPVNTDWPGREKMKRAKQGDRVGLLVDNAQGSLPVFLNDRLLRLLGGDSTSPVLSFGVSVRPSDKSSQTSLS